MNKPDLHAAAYRPSGLDELFNIRPTFFESLILVIAIVCSILLHCQPIYNSSLAIPITGVMAGLCWLTPCTSFFYISASQILPFPPEAVYNPTQLGAIIWICIVMPRYGFVQFKHSAYLILPVLWILWEQVIGGIPMDSMLRAVFFTLISIHSANASKGQYNKCLLALALGALTVIFGYWGYKLGLPILLNQSAGERLGVARLGGARSDAVLTWFAILFSIFTILGVAISCLAAKTAIRHSRLVIVSAIALFLIAIPPLVSTVSNSTFAGFIFLSLCTAFLLYRCRSFMAEIGVRLNHIILILGILIGSLTLGFALNLFDIRTKTMASWNIYTYQVDRMGSVAASRGEVWERAVQSILENPILGANFTKADDEIVTGYAAQGFIYSAHNVFIETARIAGIPSMLLAIAAFFTPFSSLRKARQTIFLLGFYLAFASMFLMWMILPYGGYKTTWALLGLLLVAGKERYSILKSNITDTMEHT